MEQQELQQNIALYYSKLPKEAQEYFAGQTWLETLREIAQKYSLNEEQIQTLGTETTLVLLGIIHIDEFEANIRREIPIPRKNLEDILIGINNSILRNVRSQIEETFRKNKTEEEAPVKIEGGLDEELTRLPQNLQEAIKKSDYKTALYAVSKEHSLNVEQMSSLEDAVLDVLAGRIKARDFGDVLKDQLGLRDERGDALIASVNEKILKKIRENMVAGTTGENAQIHKDEIAVLHQAGIKIIEPGTKPQTSIPKRIEPKPVEVKKPDLSLPELSAPVINRTSITPAMLKEKFANTFKIESIKTRHDLGNVPPAAPRPQIPKAYPKGADPYRLPPDDKLNAI